MASCPGARLRVEGGFEQVPACAQLCPKFGRVGAGEDGEGGVSEDQTTVRGLRVEGDRHGAVIDGVEAGQDVIEGFPADAGNRLVAVDRPVLEGGRASPPPTAVSPMAHTTPHGAYW